TRVRVGKVRGGVLERHDARPISGQERQEVVLGEVFGAIDEVFDDEVTGIGCGVPSVVDVERGVVYTVENIPSWQEVPLRAELEGRYGVPATINNDANAFAVGELYFGKGRGRRNLVGITLGTGLGAGVVIDGRLYSGVNCGAGELGPIPYRDATIEDYCAGRFFQREAGVAGEVVFRRAGEGDAEALRLFHAFGRELGHAVMVALYAYDPEVIVLGGSISRAFPLFAAGMRERLRDFAYQHALERVEIVRSEVEQAAVLGAAALCLDARIRSVHD
ncbi:MAG: ROK family protein, partial [Thermoanaerobaculia bacterium]